MQKTVKLRKKKKRRRISLLAKATFFFIFSLIAYFCTTLYVSTKVTEATIHIQEVQAQIDTLKQENMELTKQINALTGKERIFQAAEENNMSIDNDNIYAVASMGGN